MAFDLLETFRKYFSYLYYFVLQISGQWQKANENYGHFPVLQFNMGNIGKCTPSSDKPVIYHVIVGESIRNSYIWCKTRLN